MEKNRWIDRVKNEVGLLHRAKEERNIQNGIVRKKVNWTGHWSIGKEKVLEFERGNSRLHFREN
jgi:hypothetical protein